MNSTTMIDQPFELPGSTSFTSRLISQPSTILSNTDAPENCSTITLARKSLAVQLLATCRVIKYKTERFLALKLEELQGQPMHFIVNEESATALVDLDGPLVRCFVVGKEPAEPVEYSSLSARLLRPGARYPQCLETIEEDNEDRGYPSRKAKAFVTRCAKISSRFRRTTPSTGRPIEVEIVLTAIPDMSDMAIDRLSRLLNATKCMCSEANLTVALIRNGSKLGFWS